MAEIEAVPDNGLRVVSTFSGCGGSCLGFRMAGYRTVWANEFIPAAAEVYRLNHPGVPLNTADVRTLAPEAVLAEAGLGAGEADVLEGSPPCASFSTAGRRAAHWGEAVKYSETVQRVDDLFFEYARLLAGIWPKAFVAENVAGLVRGVAKGQFKEILAALRAPGYRVACRLLDAQWLGVPQARVRAIFVGVREDLGRDPPFPRPLPWRYSLREALDGLPPEPPGEGIGRYAIGREWLRLRPGEQSGRYFSLVRPHPDAPCPTVTSVGGTVPGAAGVVHPEERRKFTIAELRRVCGFPDDFRLAGTREQQWERLGRAVPPPMMAAVACALREGVFCG